MTKAPDADLTNALSASVQILPLPAGLYLFSVKASAANGIHLDGQLRLPALHVGLGPGVRSDQVEFIAGPATNGAWLFAKEDLLVTKVGNLGATLVLTSVRAPGGEVLTIKVERLDANRDEAVPIAPLTAAEPGREKPLPLDASVAAESLPLQITAHIRTRGDMSFSHAAWAGCLAPGLWIESFSIRPLEQFSAQDIEYKALTGSGFETPWLSDDTMCGTKGMSVPLVGFAARLKPNSGQATAYDCEYSGYFKSGLTVGPLRNGAPCRSTVANDPLEGIQMRIALRATAAVAANNAGTVAKIDPHRAPVKGPSFGRYRDEPPRTNPAIQSLDADRAAAKPEKADVANGSIGKSVVDANAGKRSPARSL
jgi:hypothetical protein